MRKLISVGFWIFFALSGLACFIIAIAIWIVTLPFDRARRINHLWSCAWAHLYSIAYPGWDVRHLYRERIDPKKTYVLVANHTSVADIVLLFGLFRQFKWVSKKQVFRLPLLGWNMVLCRYISLVRGDPKSIAAMMESCRKWLERGVSIMMFPEGTRSEDGAIRPFKHGAFTLAMDANVAVVPIAIHGGHELIPKHGKTFAARAKLVVEVLDPIPPDGFANAGQYAEHTRRVLRRALGHAEELVEELDREDAGTGETSGEKPFALSEQPR